MTDSQALHQLIGAARDMLKTGCEFARRDSPEAFAAVCAQIGKERPARIEVTLGNPVTVRAVAIDDEGEDLVQIFEMTARLNRVPGATRKGDH